VTAYIQPVVTGILLGGLYAIIGVGMSLIFGIMKLTNLAHGDFMIMSAFLTTIFAHQITGNPILALFITIIVMVPFSVLIQKFLINKVIDRGAEAPLLIMFGLSVAIQNALFLIFGSGSNAVPTALRGVNIISTAHLSVSAVHLVNFIVAVVVIGALAIVMAKTPLGRAIRASSSNTKAAELMGVNTKRMYIYAMCLTVAVTSIAGLLMGSTFIFFH
jgi:branched-chain amino acid transport system permease protein